MSSTKDLEDLVSRCLLEEMFVVTKLDPSTMPGILWGLDVTTPSRPSVRFAVISPIDRQDRVVLALGVVISPEHKRELDKLKPLEKIRAVHSILSRVLLMCPDCKIAVQPSVLDPQALAINMELFADEIKNGGKPLFTKRVTRLINTYFIVVSSFNELFPVIPQQPGKEPESGSFI